MAKRTHWSAAGVTAEERRLIERATAFKLHLRRARTAPHVEATFTTLSAARAALPAFEAAHCTAGYGTRAVLYAVTGERTTLVPMNFVAERRIKQRGAV